MNNPESLNEIDTIYTPHPDACRRFEKWRKVLDKKIKVISKHLPQYKILFYTIIYPIESKKGRPHTQIRRI